MMFEIEKKTESTHKPSKTSFSYILKQANTPLLESIKKQNFYYPTAIQKKAIPVILKGVDVIAMSRTGSGKTAAFVIPILSKLKKHSTKHGIRSIILSPNRELSLQTFLLIKHLSRGSNLRSAVIIGGESISSQFDSLKYNPDIIVATPGRFLHLMELCNLDLSSVEIIVCDEGDKLLELGLEDQIRGIISKLPKTRQSLVFSATIPNNLVELITYGLDKPEFIKLDQELKLSEDIKATYYQVNESNKKLLLPIILRQKQNQKTIVFCATKQQVEYLVETLRALHMNCVYVYGKLDQEHREESLKEFKEGDCNIMLATDMASRGIDIPLLDNVINYNVPECKKLFIHRAGRVGRQGRLGSVFTFVDSQEGIEWVDDIEDFYKVPQDVFDEEQEKHKLIEHRLGELRKSCENSMKMYKASMKKVGFKGKITTKGEGSNDNTLSVQKDVVEEDSIKKNDMLSSIRNYSNPKIKKIFGEVKRKVDIKKQKIIPNDENFLLPIFQKDPQEIGIQKYVTAICSDDPSIRKSKTKKQLNEAGKKIKGKGVDNLYKKWKSKKGNQIPNTGDNEISVKDFRQIPWSKGFNFSY